MADYYDQIREEGREEGVDIHLIGQICKKIKAGKDIQTIANEVEESVEKVRPFYDAACKHTPEYDVDAIYKELKQKHG